MTIRRKMWIGIMYAAAALVAGLGAAKAETVIRFGWELPVTHNLSIAAKMFAKSVEEKTNGSVKVQLYPAAQLTKDSTFVKAITSGTVDGGLIGTLYWTSVMPLAGIFDVPYLVRSFDEAKTVLESPVGDKLLKELEKVDVVGIGYFNYGFGIFGSNVKPLRTPADFQGLKFRTNNDIGAKLLQAYGASPTFMSGSEVFLGLQRGTVDGTHTGLSSVYSRKFWEVLKYLTTDNHNMIPYMVVIRKPLFDKLAPGEQQALRDAAKEAGAWAAEMQEKDDLAAISALKEHGMEIIELSSEELETWAKAAQPVVDYWLGSVGDEGRQMIDDINKLLGRKTAQ